MPVCDLLTVDRRNTICFIECSGGMFSSNLSYDLQIRVYLGVKFVIDPSTLGIDGSPANSGGVSSSTSRDASSFY